MNANCQSFIGNRLFINGLVGSLCCTQGAGGREASWVMALWGTNNKCLLRRRRQAYPVLNLVWQRGWSAAAAAAPGCRAPCIRAQTTARYEWESIVFMPQHPARDPVRFMNGEPWSLVHSIKGTAE